MAKHAEQTSMTVQELIAELSAYPHDDEVKIGFGVMALPVSNVYHETTYDRHYVVIN